jgi:hypothetical protein
MSRMEDESSKAEVEEINKSKIKRCKLSTVVIANTKVTADFHIPLTLSKSILKRGNVT